jgi:hypothetical protein
MIDRVVIGRITKKYLLALFCAGFTNTGRARYAHIFYAHHSHFPSLASSRQ